MELPRIPYPGAVSSAEAVARPYQEVAAGLDTISKGLSAFAQEQTKNQMFKASTQLQVEMSRTHDELTKMPGISAGELRQFGVEHLPADVREELKGKEDTHVIQTWRVMESMFDRRARVAKEKAARLIYAEGWRSKWSTGADADVLKHRSAVTSRAMNGALEEGQVEFLDTFKAALAAGDFEGPRKALAESALFGAPVKAKLEQDIKDTEAFQPAEKAMAGNDIPGMEAALKDLRSPPKGSPQEFADPAKRNTLASQLETRLKVAKAEEAHKQDNAYATNEQWAGSNINEAIFVRGEKGKALFKYLPAAGIAPEVGGIREEKWRTLARMIEDTIPDPTKAKEISDPVTIHTLETAYGQNPQLFSDGMVELPVGAGKMQKFSFLDLREKGLLSASDFSKYEGLRHQARLGVPQSFVGSQELVSTILSRPQYGIPLTPSAQSEADRQLAAEVYLYVNDEFRKIPGADRLGGEDRTRIFESLTHRGFELKSGKARSMPTAEAQSILGGRAPRHGVKTQEQEMKQFQSYLPQITKGLLAVDPVFRRGIPDATKVGVYDYLHDNWGAIEAQVRALPGMEDAPLDNIKRLMTLRAVDLYLGRAAK